MAVTKVKPHKVRHTHTWAPGSQAPAAPSSVTFTNSAATTAKVNRKRVAANRALAGRVRGRRMDAPTMICAWQASMFG